MVLRLEFTRVHNYDAGDKGITVPVLFHTSSEDQIPPIAAKVDTGAELCGFRREVGEALGLKIEAGDKIRISGIEGTPVYAYGHEVSYSILGFQFAAMIYFGDFPRNLLGRRGFIEHMKIGIVDYDGKLFLSRYDDE